MLPKGELKRLIYDVIDINKDVTKVVFLDNAGSYSLEKPFYSINTLPQAF